MKKVFLSAALALTVAGSWAFYPNESQPGNYMQLAAYSEDGRGTIVITTPEGRVSVTQVKEFDSPLARAKTVIKLNELRHEGWQVVQMTVADGSPTHNDRFYYNRFNEVYLLEKR